MSGSGPTSLPVHPVTTEKTWFGKVANSFAAFQPLPSEGGGYANLDSKHLCASSRLAAESYSYMFGPKGMVTGVLNKDVEDNTGGFEKVWAALGGEGNPALATIEGTLGVELGGGRPVEKLRYDRKSALVCALWISRALLFVARFGSRLIQTPGASPASVAKEVYLEVLRPFHGFLIANVVSLAFSLAPSRVDFFSRMNTKEEEAREELDAFIKYVLPVAEAYNAYFTQKGWNFPDKV